MPIFTRGWPPAVQKQAQASAKGDSSLIPRIFAAKTWSVAADPLARACVAPRQLAHSVSAMASAAICSGGVGRAKPQRRQTSATTPPSASQAST